MNKQARQKSETPEGGSAHCFSASEKIKESNTFNARKLKPINSIEDDKVTRKVGRQRFRNFAFTQYGGRLPFKENMMYMVQGYEICPTTGRDHIQGFVVFKNSRSLTGVIKEFKGTHWEVAYSGISRNIDYCKKGHDWIEDGTIPREWLRVKKKREKKEWSFCGSLSDGKIIKTTREENLRLLNEEIRLIHREQRELGFEPKKYTPEEREEFKEMIYEVLGVRL